MKLKVLSTLYGSFFAKKKAHPRVSEIKQYFKTTLFFSRKNVSNTWQFDNLDRLVFHSSKG
ncbi:MAG: hypothetical protein AAFO82_24050 [Bacteroidota bacterium]